LLILVIGGTYAFINLTLTGTKRQVITAGTLSLELKEDDNNLTIQNAMPMYDEVGLIQDAFTFRLINNGTTSANYKVKLVEIGTGTLSKSDVKYGLTKDGEKTIGLLSDLPASGVIDSGVIGASPETIEYSLRLWIKDDVTDNSAISGKSLSYRVDVEVGQETEIAQCPILPETVPNPPVLASGMIPVTYNETEKTWVTADTSAKWYDYENQIWANAVTVSTEEARNTYKSATPGTPVSMDDINTMWVWIPRYSYTIMQPYGRNQVKCSDLEEITIHSPSNCYNADTLIYPDELRAKALTACQTLGQQLGTVINTEDDCVKLFQDEAPFNSFEGFIDYYIEAGLFEDTRVPTETYPNNYTNDATQELPGAIDIKFISTEQKDNGTGQCENCAENWVTPEGFKFGEENIPGFWIAKFETSILETCVAASDSVNTGCDLTTFTLQVKPNVESWRGARVSTYFEASRLMQSSTNAPKYGFTTVGNGTMDTHMLKNTEWGIVAYLSQSKYGKYGNPNYTGMNKEVYQNSSPYTTGMSNQTANPYETLPDATYDTPDTGYGASTTGTIYGVYDMSSGAEEYVMGNYNNVSGFSTSTNSGFCGTNGPTEVCVEWPESKYYDLYTSDDASSTYKAGDATYETNGWYDDSTDFIDSNHPWLQRSGIEEPFRFAGVFGMRNGYGEANGNNASRLAIKP